MELTEGYIREHALHLGPAEELTKLYLSNTGQILRNDEKIRSLGTALHAFTGLIEIDLSRNEITSLAGLENCVLLNRLKLFCNKVSSLDEVKRLQVNVNLRELDLRLNPVAKRASYRLDILTLLPFLTRLGLPIPALPRLSHTSPLRPCRRTTSPRGRASPSSCPCLCPRALWRNPAAGVSACRVIPRSTFPRHRGAELA